MNSKYVDFITKGLYFTRKCVIKILQAIIAAGISGGPFVYLSYLSSQGYEMDANAYLYTLSTIPQTIAALIGLFGIFVVLKIKDFRKDVPPLEGLKIISFTFPLVFGITTIVFSLMFLPFIDLKLNNIDFLSSIEATPLEVIGVALGLCFSTVFFMIKPIYTLIREEVNNLFR